jgi:hypothetical protein
LNINQINSGHYHEVLDRIHWINCLIEDAVFKSLPADHHPGLKAKVEEAMTLLSNAYQICGDALWTLEDKEKAIEKTRIIKEWHASQQCEAKTMLPVF